MLNPRLLTSNSILHALYTLSEKYSIKWLQWTIWIFLICQTLWSTYQFLAFLVTMIWTMKSITLTTFRVIVKAISMLRVATLLMMKRRTMIMMYLMIISLWTLCLLIFIGYVTGKE
ncbi:putative accessory protein [Plumbago necrotic spot associated virus]|nr:putative accessory protein [Plumbago necrotic spot associated virus]DBA37008.1 TPA_asm: P overlapped [Fagopyrum alphacytorhabdovirus 1]